VERNVEKITSRRNPICVHTKKLGTSRSYRNEHSEFLCDGEKLLKEAVDNNANIVAVLTSKKIEHSLPEGTLI